jgi:hypothetical protein
MVKQGDKVEFTGRRGLVQGIVILTRAKTSRKIKKLNRQFPNLSLNPELTIAEVADLKNKIIYTVDVYSLKPIGKATRKTLDKARDLKFNIVDGNEAIKEKRRQRNLNWQEEKGIENLLPGDKIEVKYKGYGWIEEEFSHYTSSGKIAFKSRNVKSGIRYAWPEFVRSISA